MLGNETFLQTTKLCYKNLQFKEHLQGAQSMDDKLLGCHASNYRFKMCFVYILKVFYYSYECIIIKPNFISFQSRYNFFYRYKVQKKFCDEIENLVFFMEIFVLNLYGSVKSYFWNNVCMSFDSHPTSDVKPNRVGRFL